VTGIAPSFDNETKTTHIGLMTNLRETSITLFFARERERDHF